MTRNRGRLVVGLMLGVGLLAAGVAWWHQYRQGTEVLTCWGPTSAGRIRLARRCELWRLAPASAAAAKVDRPRLTLQGTVWVAWATRDITQARGILHARQALIEDASYDWSRGLLTERPNWSDALCFSDQGGQTVLVFDLTAGLVCQPETGQVASIAPIRAGLREFFAEQWSH